jgi:predicted transcriptional regulator
MSFFVLGDRELDVMRALLDLGCGTVSEVRARLAVDVGHTSVQIALEGLKANSFIDDIGDATGHRYAPKVPLRSRQSPSHLVQALGEVLSGAEWLLLRSKQLSAGLAVRAQPWRKTR